MNPPDQDRLQTGTSPDEDAPQDELASPRGRVSIFEDERRRLRHRLELQDLVHSFSSQMRSQRDVESIATILTEAVSDLTSFRNAMVSVLDRDGRTLRGVAVSGHKRTFEIGIRLSKYSVKRILVDLEEVPAYVKALRTGEVVYHRTKEDIVNTLANLTGLNPGILEIIRRTTRMNMALSVPLFVGDVGDEMVPIGLLAISSIRSEVDPEDVRVVRILADQASLAIYNARLFEDLKQQVERAEMSESRFRSIMDSAQDMIISHSPTGHVNFANNAIRESGVYDMAGELFGPAILERVHPDDQPRLVEVYLGLTDGVPVRSVEYRIRTDNGEWLTHNLVANVVKDRDGTVRETVTFIRDVTQERYRERQVVRRNRELEVLNALITNLTSGLDFDEMISRSLSIIAEFTQADMITIYKLIDRSAIDIIGHLWIPDELREWLAVNIPKVPESDVLNFNEVLVLNDLSLLPKEYHKIAQQFEVDAIITVPIKAEGRVIGYVLAGSKVPLEIDDEDMAILRTVGDQLGLVLRTATLLDDRSRNGSSH